jgi:hypothetical protein
MHPFLLIRFLVELYLLKAWTFGMMPVYNTYLECFMV